MSGDSIDTDKLTAADWTLYDKVLYGGFGYSEFCLPDNLLLIALAVIYPPLGMISQIIRSTIIHEFPYITANTFITLFQKMDRIVYSIIYTMFLYIPGLIYTLKYIVYGEDEFNSEKK